MSAPMLKVDPASAPVSPSSRDYDSYRLLLSHLSLCSLPALKQGLNGRLPELIEIDPEKVCMYVRMHAHSHFPQNPSFFALVSELDHLPLRETTTVFVYCHDNTGPMQYDAIIAHSPSFFALLFELQHGISVPYTRGAAFASDCIHGDDEPSHFDTSTNMHIRFRFSDRADGATADSDIAVVWLSEADDIVSCKLKGIPEAM